MTRKKLVTTLSIIYIINGLWDIGIFLYQASLPSGPIIEITSFVGTVLAFYLGFQLLQRREFGRKIAIFLLYVDMAIYAVLFFVSLYDIQTTKGKFIVAGLSFRDKLIYPIGNPYVVPGSWLVLTLITLLIIVFLSQAKTRQLFTPKISS
jgi:hypothetical protein